MKKLWELGCTKEVFFDFFLAPHPWESEVEIIYETKHNYILYIMQKQSMSYLQLIFFYDEMSRERSSFPGTVPLSKWLPVSFSTMFLLRLHPENLLQISCAYKYHRNNNSDIYLAKGYKNEHMAELQHWERLK